MRNTYVKQMSEARSTILPSSANDDAKHVASHRRGKCTALSPEKRRLRGSARKHDGRCLYCGKPADVPLFTRTALTSCSDCKARLGYTNTLNARFKRAKRQNIKGWSLSLKKYKQLISQPCHYCGLPQDAHERGTGLDRCNPSRGYHDGNVVSCCGVCNIVRNSWFTVDEMKLLGKAVRKIKLARLAAKGNNQ